MTQETKEQGKMPPPPKRVGGVETCPHWRSPLARHSPSLGPRPNWAHPKPGLQSPKIRSFMVRFYDSHYALVQSRWEFKFGY